MTWTQLITQLFEIVIFPLLGVATIYLINLIKAKNAELKEKYNNDLYYKYSTMLEQTIIDCVLATNQTYVESLKKQGKFDLDAQKQAFTMTYERIMSLLTEDAKKFLEEAICDLNLYVQNKIEAEVLANK